MSNGTKNMIWINVLIVAFVAFGVFSGNVCASEEPEGHYGLAASIGSKHFIQRDAEYAYNESNPGLAVVYYFPDDSRAILTGFYKNSDSNESVFVAYKMYARPFRNTSVNPSLTLGAATGYDNLPLFPMFVVALDFHVINNHKLNLLAAPLASEKSEDGSRNYGMVLGLQYEYEFR